MRVYCMKFTVITLVAVLLANCQKIERDNLWDEKATLDTIEWSPQNFQVEDVGITEKKLSWTFDDKNIGGFKLDRKKGDEPWQVAYQTLAKETRSWNDTDIVPDPALTYSYRLYTFAGKNVSGEKTTTASAEIPAPTNLQVEKLSDISYKLTWQDNSNGEDGFKIDRKTADSEWVIGYGTVGENTTTFVDTNVFAGKSSINIQYRVYAFCKEFESDKTDASTYAALTPPANLQITQNSITSVTLNWQDNSTGEEGFRIERKQGTANWEMLTTLTGISFTDTDFLLNTDVSYRVAAYHGQYASDYVESSFNSQIPAPTNLQITQNTITSVNLSWQINSTGEEGFRIERKQGTGDWELLTTLTGTSYTDDAFELNTDVSYRVASYHGQYASDYVESSFNSQIAVPENLTITANSVSSLTLNWSYGLAGHEGFKIDRKVNGGAWVEEFVILNFDQTNHVDEEVDINNRYSYRVYAYFAQHYSNKEEIDAHVTEIGENYAGGIVFYLDGNGGGLVCAESDQSSAIWGCHGTSIGGTGTGIGTGAANTAAIVAGCGESGIAARICNDLVLNGYSDWFLSSKDELNLMYQSLKLNGFGGFADNTYWSSSEYSPNYARVQNFANGYQGDTNKSSSVRVRAVRAF